MLAHLLQAQAKQWMAIYLPDNMKGTCNDTIITHKFLKTTTTLYLTMETQQKAQ